MQTARIGPWFCSNAGLLIPSNRFAGVQECMACIQDIERMLCRLSSTIHVHSTTSCTCSQAIMRQNLAWRERSEFSQANKQEARSHVLATAGQSHRASALVIQLQQAFSRKGESHSGAQGAASTSDPRSLMKDSRAQPRQALSQSPSPRRRHPPRLRLLLSQNLL